MARCIRCRKLSLFKSFPNGLCAVCSAEIEKENKLKELQEKQERLRREIEEQERIAAEAQEQLRRAEMLILPEKLMGKAMAYSYKEVNLFVPDPSCFDKIKVGTKLNARKDPNNPYDKNAVRLEWNRDVLAYFYRGKLQDMANDYLMVGGLVHGIVTELLPEDKKIQASVGFYKGEEQDELKSYLSKDPRAKMYKLTGTSSESRQDNLLLSDVGDKCSIEYDAEKEKYLVYDGDEIGYLPAAAAKLVDEAGEFECSVFIAKVDTDDNGKYCPFVYIFFD